MVLGKPRRIQSLIDVDQRRIMYLDDVTFRTVVDSTPLVSIDLVLRSKIGEVLLGYRNNRPAQEFWFVPGGRIMKNETLDQAFSRIALDELGLSLNRTDAIMLGVYEHIYEDSIFGSGIGTHYVVLAYEVSVTLDKSQLPISQHSEYQWWSEGDLISAPEVHVNTKSYFSTGCV